MSYDREAERLRYTILEHELKAIDSLHNQRDYAHLAAVISAALGVGSVVAMVVLVVLGERLSGMTWQIGMTVAGAIAATGAWCWKRRLKARLEALMHRIKLRGYGSGPPPPDSPNPGRRVKIG